MPELRIESDANGVVGAAASFIVALLERAARGTERFTVALAGGSTPGPIYRKLAEYHATVPLPLENVELYFGDERCVAPDDADSNYRTVKEALIDPVGESAFRAVHRVRGEEEDVEAEAERYGALLPDAFDLVILGMGEDGHTASLFPGATSILETERRAVAVEGPKPPPRRVTITAPMIVGARVVLVVTAGFGKSPALARALDGPVDPHATPIQLALSSEPGRDRVWIVDRAAAQDLHAGWW